MKAVGALYDNLNNFEHYISGRKPPFPIHKKIYNKGKRISIPQLILGKKWIKPESFILDAGCGNGYSLVFFTQNLKCRGIGISLSNREIDSAKKAAELHRLNNSISFQKLDYNNPPDEKFDVILAIESLKHSQDLNSTIQKLSEKLKKGGLFIVVDDMLVDRHNAGKTDYYKKTWELYHTYSLSNFDSAFSSFELIEEVDLTGSMKQKNHKKLKVYYLSLKLLGKIPFIGKYFSILSGGIYQELMYSQGRMSYRLRCYKND